MRRFACHNTAMDVVVARDLILGSRQVQHAVEAVIDSTLSEGSAANRRTTTQLTRAIESVRASARRPRLLRSVWSASLSEIAAVDAANRIRRMARKYPTRVRRLYARPGLLKVLDAVLMRVQRDLAEIPEWPNGGQARAIDEVRDELSCIKDELVREARAMCSAVEVDLLYGPSVQEFAGLVGRIRQVCDAEVQKAEMIVADALAEMKKFVKDHVKTLHDAELEVTDEFERFCEDGAFDECRNALLHRLEDCLINRY